MPWSAEQSGVGSDRRLSLQEELAHATALAIEAVAQADRNLSTPGGSRKKAPTAAAGQGPGKHVSFLRPPLAGPPPVKASPSISKVSVHVAVHEAEYEAALFDEADAMFDALDADQDGFLDRQEWIAGSLKGLGVEWALGGEGLEKYLA